MTNQRAILVVHQGAELYGSDRMVLQLLKVLHDHPATYVTLHVPHSGPLVDYAQPLIDALLIAPISVLRLSLLKRFCWLNIVQFYRNMRLAWQQLQQHDTIIVNSCVVLTYLILLPFYRGAKYVYVHEINTGILKLGFNILLRLTGASLICNSHATAQNYASIATSRKYTVYNAVAQPRHPSTKSYASDIHLLIIGRVSPRKGHAVLIKALQMLSLHERSNIQLRIVGHSYANRMDFIDILKQDIKNHGLNDQVSWHDFTNDPASHYEWAHCVVVPSIQPESFGLVALEAMHHCCAVIASHTGALPEIVVHNQTGQMVEPNNPHALCTALQNYGGNPSQMIAHGEAGRDRAMHHFTTVHYQDRIQDVLYG